MVFLTGSGTRHCPVEGCIGLVETQTDMLVHLWYQYVQDTVVIIEKGNLSHPQCPPPSPFPSCPGPPFATPFWVWKLTDSEPLTRTS